MMLPPSLEELIEENHPVRVVNQIIDSINIDPLLKKFKGGGTSSYHPRMLLKVLVYGYLNNTYSSRRMEAGLKENIHFMWLAGMSKPDHNTINRFRSDRLKDVLKTVFGKVVELLVEAGHLSLQEVYTDGTKLEAQANRYSFVWGKAIRTNRARIEEQLKELWAYAERLTKEELKDKAPQSFEPVSARQVNQIINRIDKALEGKEISKKRRQKLDYAKKNWPQQAQRYKRQQQILGKRNSYSKTDPDATFMRLKEDHMRGQPKPAYNVQLSSHNQFVVNYTVHQNPTDTTTLKKHLDSFQSLYKKDPDVLVADAGYGSEENYKILNNRDIEGYVKHNQFDRQHRTKQPDPFRPENLVYDKKQDIVYCPSGKPMKPTGKVITSITANGFKQKLTKYKAVKCTGCPLRPQCHNQKGNRTVNINHRLRKFKQQADQLLITEQGIVFRKKRSSDIETVFANIKHNKGFRRFMLKGLNKVEIETGLLALAHNLGKLAT
jgi:transposase